MKKLATVPILMYHQVAPDRHPAFGKYTVQPEAFAAQMKWLSLAGYKAVTLDELLANRQEGRPLPGRPVVITFDDGYQGCADYAVPALEKYGFTAIFYLVAGLAGRNTAW